MATRKKDKQITTGKRKSAIARVKVVPGEGKVTVNGKSAEDYFGAQLAIHKQIQIPLELTGNIGKKDIHANIRGGGKAGQAAALMYAVAKALAEQKETARKNLKAAGLLSRDARIKESKKYGRKKARKKFQFSKR